MDSTIGKLRLHHQRISRPSLRDAGAVAAWMGALQGQDYAGTKWALGLRVPGGTDTDIEAAIADRSIRRSWVLRGTLHYVAAADLHWMVGLVAPRLIDGNAHRYRELQLDADTLARSSDLIAEALADGRPQTRTELLAMLEARGISTTGGRGYYMLQRAGLERRVYQGAVERNVTTFVALEPGSTLPKEQALAELARRYFISHGPATLDDFAHWSGLPVGEARAGLDGAKSALIQELIGGRAYWLSPEAAEPPERAVYLLPGFDEFVLGYKDRSAVLDPAFADAICPGGNGMFFPTIVCSGRIIGTWKRTVKKKAVEIVLSPFYTLTRDAREQIVEAAEGYGRFLGLPAVVI